MLAWNFGSDYNWEEVQSDRLTGASPETMTGPISITVNGETRAIKTGASLMDLLRELGLESGRVAVERNRQILPRSQWLETVLTDGDHFEIVHFVGGG